MKRRINMISIVTADLPAMKDFYHQVLGFEIKLEMDNFVEFESEGVRFALSTREVMVSATGDESYRQTSHGHTFELAFRLDSPQMVDQTFNDITSGGVKPIRPPQAMPWGQYTAFFADPDGNIHELFTDLPE